MNATASINNLLHKGFLALITVIFLTSVVFAGDFKNGGTLVNKSGKTFTVAAGNFINKNGSNNGTVRNAGTLSVTNGSYLNVASSFTYNWFSGVGGTFVVKNAFDASAGTVANDSVHTTPANTIVGTIKTADSLKIGGTFTTDHGKVEFDGSADQYIPGIAYGALVASGTNGWKKLVADASVNDSMRINSTFNDSTHILTVYAPTGITGGGGYLKGTQGTINYAADANQAVYSGTGTTYKNLTLSGAVSSRNKQASGAVSISGNLTIDASDSLDVVGAITFSGTLLNSGGLKMAGNADFTGATFTTPGTAVYYGTSAQTVATGTFTYANLVFRDSSAAKNIGGNINVSGNVTLEAIGRTKVVIASGTFTYTGTGGSQNIAALDYRTLSFTGNSQKTVGGWVNAATALSVASSVDGNAGANFGLYVASTGTLVVANGADFTNDGLVTNDGTITVN